MNNQRTFNINSTLDNRKTIHVFIQLSFFLSWTVKSFEILTKHNGYGFISDSFALN